MDAALKHKVSAAFAQSAPLRPFAQRCILSTHDTNRCASVLPSYCRHAKLPAERETRGRTTPRMRNDTHEAHERVILSIDVGTSGAKAALCYIDNNGRLGQISRNPLSTDTSGNHQVTQKIADWYEAAIATARNALSSAPNDVNVLAIAVTGQMQNLVAVGSWTPALLGEDAILYSDSRAHETAMNLSHKLNKTILPTDILPKLSLLPDPRKSEVLSYDLLLGAADYIIHELASMPKPIVTDSTTVSTTGLTKSPHRTYDMELLEEAGLSQFANSLPRILGTVQQTGVLSTQSANALGDRDLAGTPLVHAGGDAFTSTIGAGCGTKSDIYLYAGTSGWIGGTLPSDTPEYTTMSGAASRGLFELAHAVDATDSVVVGSMACACGNFEYARETFLGGVSMEHFIKLVDDTNIGANGVSYVPYIVGSRCPPAKGLAAGSLHGLSGASTKGDIARAVLEGVVYGMRLCRDELPGEMVRQMDETPLRLVGGGAKCEAFVMGISALVAGRAGIVIGETDGVGVRGAATVACSAIGLKDLVDSWDLEFEATETTQSEKELWERGMSKWTQCVQAEQAIWSF